MQIIHKNMHIVFIYFFCLLLFIPNTFAGENVNCVNELKKLQRELNKLIGQGNGPRRFNPSVLSTDYEIYRRNPMMCSKHVNEIIMYIAEGRSRAERDLNNQNLYKPPDQSSTKSGEESYTGPDNIVEEKDNNIFDEESHTESDNIIEENTNTLSNESSHVDKCSIEQRIALAEAGYTKDEIEKLCSPKTNENNVTTPSNSNQRDDQEELKVVEILQKMANVYNTCSTYQDFGKQITTYAGSNKNQQRLFFTSFIRPDWFFFEFSELIGGRPQKFVILGSKNGVKSFGPPVGEQEYPSLHLAIAAATGLSGGISHTVPNLLMPSIVGGWSLTELENIVRTGDENMGDYECFKLEGKNDLETKFTLWIDKNTFLILKINEFDDLSNRNTEYNPKINQLISIKP